MVIPGTLVILWWVGLIGAGSATVGLAIYHIKAGYITSGRPPRTYYRVSDPNNFWGVIVWGMLVGGVFLVAGTVGLVRAL